MDLNKQYERAVLNEADLDPDPIREFGRWFDAAVAAQVPEPNAMTLATATRDGLPSARIVLLKAFDDRGFAFFTNYESQKGRELTANPQAALVVFWPTLERQVRITGPVTTVPRDESELYFHSRPIASQLGAWASPQSQVLISRESLEQRFEEIARDYGPGPVPLPPFWGGFRVRPAQVEFWQGRVNRLHDRIRYSNTSQGSWRIERIAP